MTPSPSAAQIEIESYAYRGTNDDITITELNVPLFTEVLAWVYAEAEKPAYQRNWDQAGFYGYRPGCGTTYCFAGYTRSIAEQRRLIDDVPAMVGTGYVAMEVLGLTAAEAEYLFYGLAPAQDADPIREMAEYVFTRRGLLPPLSPQTLPSVTPTPVKENLPSCPVPAPSLQL